MKTNNYYVIGGQYEQYCYGGTPTLIGAKRLANKNKEYWDNWQGWHTPQIYKAEDTEVIESRNNITSRDGEHIRIVKDYADPVY
jgi:hypothetical protein